MSKDTYKKGFTLIELLIVVAVIAILATVTFVSFNPLKRFQDARDSARLTDIVSMATALKVDQVDNGGLLLDSVTSTVVGDVYMIVSGSAMTTGCADNNAYCDTNVTSDTHCANLLGLVTEGYLAALPVSGSSGNVTWDLGDTNGDEGTGYTFSRSATNAITIRACESENTTEISITS